MTKFIFFSGGVASSIGKGVSAASLGAVLEARGISTTIIKLDPYINVDPGTMNPSQHGEVFVTHDGAETDLDLGHYERFLNRRMSKVNNCTAGQIYERVIQRERKGEYLGATIQVIPHITDEIKRLIKLAATKNKVDVVIVEVGGTVGDIESQPFLEAIRQMRLELKDRDASCYVHMTYVPQLAAAGEIKTKPTQHSVRELREIGIQPDLLLCRSAVHLPMEHRSKIALFSNLSSDHVFGVPDVGIIYELPLHFVKMGIDKVVCDHLSLPNKKADLSSWKKLLADAKKRKKEVRIGFVGKYGNPNQSYRSLIEALEHAGIHTGKMVKIVHLDIEDFEKNGDKMFDSCDAILVPGAFGERGIAGKLTAIQMARERNKPFLGICIGMQLAIVEYARNKLNLKGADSVEFNVNTPHPVICLEVSQDKVDGNLGGTMRLGSSKCKIVKGTLLSSIYDESVIEERHRHRYEFNLDYLDKFENSDMVISSWSKENEYCEAVEIKGHKWFVATQFHPEYESTPRNSHPLFKSFILAASKRNS